ncbi:hypothetical protein G6F57_004268 [Rhizopus arrhizus]|uniref:CBM21 domain-containing protein n=1 Tax=Rhizopus oryzae TaxID=64495 RepID=A0A9P6XDP9_RHIOR|nr:hypothetical protein G6F23_012176 [Rhizopus arrhizus]KAG1417206.1 hypothetical protein G6F58_005629 [Rhizopus delemar]KAG0765956.1 hypothetical protein G6F24_003997 [Rhizopus arrhizus]KAG0792785.1 hypothetical protein G6F21_004101 [Rhizopus arrhizus]KAG0813976.1 hypothetical protein G6F20_005139 [Rhizopus arrhizus]
MSTTTTTTTTTTTLLTHKKRIVLKRSIPYYPIYNESLQKKKSVRFNDEQLEQVVYFYKSRSPKSIHEQEDDVILADECTITKPNWPSRTRLLYEDNKIRMENVKLLDGEDCKKNQFVMEGRCRALNISYQKIVTVRYTFDLWSTYQETTGIFKESIPSTSNTWDRFLFSIPIEAKEQTIYFALKYSVNGQDYWDNNNGLNYQVTIALPVIAQPQPQLQQKKTLSKRYDFSPPSSPPITPPIEYTLPIFIQKQDPFEMSYTDFVNKYCFYNSHSEDLIYNTPPSAVFT